MTALNHAPSPQDELEQALRELSAPDPRFTVSLWEAALDSTHASRTDHVSQATLVPFWRRLPLSTRLRTRTRTLALAGIAACLVIAAWMSVSTTVDSASWKPQSLSKMGSTPQEQTDQSFRDVPQIDIYGVLAQGNGGLGSSPFADKTAAMPAAAAVTSSDVRGSPSRLIAQKARIEITVEDVSATFRRLGAEIETHPDEFIESSAFGGGDSATSAAVVLRVMPDRLPAVLGHLRSLGKVTAETSGVDDVTDQVVDLDARILNERCVESELLDLLDHRTDSPLREILELRGELSKVRGSIERLVAQRDRLSRLVALARVEVILSLPTKVEERSLFLGLGDKLSSGTRDAARGLLESTIGLWTGIIRNAFLLAIIVAGSLIARTLWKRRSRPLSGEPAPRMA